MTPRRPVPALDKALRLLSARAYSSGELTQRLIRAGYLSEEAAAAVEECYDAIAVLLRVIDVLEGRQPLGRPDNLS